jgi:aminoglycoside phosphotransferase (APT) family kinase protein
VNLDDPQLRAQVEHDVSAWAGAAVRLQAWSRLSGGAIQENHALDLVMPDGNVRRVVLRTDAPSQVAASRSRADEFALLRVAHAAGVRVPEPLACFAGSAQHPAYFVMAHVPGVAAAHRLTRDGALPDPRALARERGANLARIHALAPPRAELAMLGPVPAAPTRALLLACRTYLDHWRATFGTTWPALEWGVQWWLDRAPAHEPVTLVHRDYRTGNQLVHDGRLAATLDWEFAGWGNPLEDIGWCFAPCWRFAGRDRVAGGIADADDFLAGYNEVAGTRYTEADTRDWQALAQLRWATIALQQCERHLRGGERSLELALTGRLLPGLEADLLLLTPPQDAHAATVVGARGVHVTALQGRASSEGALPLHAGASGTTPMAAMEAGAAHAAAQDVVRADAPAATSPDDVPALADLLGTARAAVQDQLLPHLAGDARYVARMVANALAIAARELAAAPPDDDPWRALARLAGSADSAAAGDRRRLAEALTDRIRARRFADDAGAAARLHAALLEWVGARLAIDDPRLFARLAPHIAAVTHAAREDERASVPSGDARR